MSRLEKYFSLTVLAVLLTIRLFWLAGPLEGAVWRQSFAAYQARCIARESPPELLRVKVPFQGTNDVSDWNFPLYEGLVGLSYKAAGGENLALARFITLLFFCGGAGFWYLALRRLFDVRVAGYSLLAYLSLPLGIYYSRAVHYDFVLLFFVQVYFYYGLRYFDSPRLWPALLASTAGAMACLIKPPYCAPMGAALLVAALWRTPRVRNLGRLLALHILPLAALWWMHHIRVLIDGREPWSPLYPAAYTTEAMSNWFLGDMGGRFPQSAWVILARRLVLDVATPVGVYALLIACLLPAGSARRGMAVLWGAALGAAAYTLLIFPIVASSHDYYSLPFLAPVSAGIGLFLTFIAAPSAGPASRLGLARVAATLLLMWAGAGYALKRGFYLECDWQRMAAGQTIAAHTAPDELVVSVLQGRSTGWTDPQILYFADRRGWSSRLDMVDAARRQQYRAAGATRAALLLTPDYPPDPANYGVLAGQKNDIFPLTDPAGAAIGWLVIFDLGTNHE